MKIKLIVISAAILLIVTFQFLNAAEELSLEDAVRISLDNNYTIKIARSEAQIDENNVSRGNAGFLPSLDLTGRANKSNQNVSQVFLDGSQVEKDGAQSSLYEGNLGLNWTVFDGFRMFISFDRLSDLKDIGQLKLKSKVELTIRDVVNSYYNILRQKLALDVATDNLEISRSRYQYVNDRFEVGTASKIDLLQAGVDLNADISDSLDQQINYDNIKIEFNKLLNRNIDAEFNVSANLEIPNDYQKSELEKVDNNIDIRIAHKIVEINKYDIEALRSEFYPRISLYGTYNYTQQVSESGFLSSNTSYGYNYGLNLSLNLFDGFNTSREIQNAQVNTEISNYMLRELKMAVTSAVSTSLNSYTKFKELSRFESENVSAARENMELALESLNLGLMSALEFRETQRRLSNAKLRLITSIYNAKINETELLRLTGSLVKEQ